MSRFSISVLLVVLVKLTAAQDVHWSQPAGPLVFQNPAFAGLTSRYYIAGSYRDQWNVLGQTYRTALLSADYRLQKDELKNSVSMGASFFSDNMASGAYRQTVGRVCLSYQVMVNENSRLSGGVAYSFIQSSIFTDPYTWGSQFNGLSYDPSLKGEPVSWGRKTASSVGCGVSYFFDADPGAVSYYNNAKWMAGYSLDHVNRPDAGMFGLAEPLKMRHGIFLSGFIPAGGNNGLKPLLSGYLQGPAMQLAGGLLVRYSLGQISRYTGIKQGEGISFGVLYRSNDALIPTFEYERGNMLAGISYDVTLSKFGAATNLRGGIEISLRLRALSNYLYKEKTPAPAPSTRRFPGT